MSFFVKELEIIEIYNHQIVEFFFIMLLVFNVDTKFYTRIPN